MTRLWSHACTVHNQVYQYPWHGNAYRLWHSKLYTKVTVVFPWYIQWNTRSYVPKRSSQISPCYTYMNACTYVRVVLCRWYRIELNSLVWLLLLLLSPAWMSSRGDKSLMVTSITLLRQQKILSHIHTHTHKKKINFCHHELDSTGKFTNPLSSDLAPLSLELQPHMHN